MKLRRALCNQLRRSYSHETFIYIFYEERIQGLNRTGNGGEYICGFFSDTRNAYLRIRRWSILLWQANSLSQLAENGLEEHDIVIIKLIVAIILRNQHVQHAKNVSGVVLISLCLHSPSQLNILKARLTGAFDGVWLSPSFFAEGTGFSVSLLFSDVRVSDFASGFDPTISSPSAF